MMLVGQASSVHNFLLLFHRMHGGLAIKLSTTAQQLLALWSSTSAGDSVCHLSTVKLDTVKTS